MTTLPKKKTVLLVDDDLDYLEQQKLQIESAGFEVICCQDKDEAESLLEKTKPDLAVLDLMMQQVDDGFMLSYHLKKKYPDVPVIIVSGVTSETGIDFQDKGGSWIKADVMLPKPIRFEQLKLEMDRLLGINSDDNG